jgi:hypothetical protein
MFFKKIPYSAGSKKTFRGHPLEADFTAVDPQLLFSWAAGPKEPLVWMRELEHAANPLTVTFFPMSSSPLKPHIILFHNLLLPGWARLPIPIKENVEVSTLRVRNNG